jgi:bleomycin hydrolase
MKALLILIIGVLAVDCYPQAEDFEIIIQNPSTEVKFQLLSGQYCWSYATCSFLESELIRKGKGEFNLSEDFFIYQSYIDKALNYVLRQGYTSFKNGGLAHDVLRIVEQHGIVPDPFYKIDYIPYTKGPTVVLSSYLKTILAEDVLSENWKKHFLGLLDSYFNERTLQFQHENKTYTPEEFAQYLEIDAKDYISITSFLHHPFNIEFVLEIPDNYASGLFLNLPIDSLVQIVDSCLFKGYTVVWDGCIEGNGYSYDKGLVMEPEDRSIKEQNLVTTVVESDISQQKRQIAFERLQVTDDHLMHIIGIAKNPQGKKFYIVKDSGGEYGPYNGFLYMSESFFKMKTIAITLNKNALPRSITQYL